MARNLEIDGRKLKDIQVINAVDSDTKEYVPYIDTHDATATSEDIIEGKTAYVDGKEVVGIHPDIQSPYASFAALVDGSITEVTAEMIEGATKIRDYAFYYCDSMTSITIPEGVTKISDYAFWGCTSLTSVTIPDRVMFIGLGVFRNTKLHDVVIPANIVSIGTNAFGYINTLTSVTFKGNVPGITSFGYNSSCSKYDMRYATAVPTISSTTALGHAKGCKLIVPDALYDEWKAATNWVALTDVVWVKASEYVEE